MASAEVEETIRRLSSHKGVEGIVISTYEGVALRSTLSAELTTRYAGLMTQLVLRARGAVRTIDAEVRGAACGRGSAAGGAAGSSAGVAWVSGAAPLTTQPLSPSRYGFHAKGRMTSFFCARARASMR
jgi:hypothetical protein